MIIYGVLGPPRYESTHDQMGVPVKMSYDEEEIIDEVLLFDDPESAFRFYKKAARYFPFFTDNDVNLWVNGENDDDGQGIPRSN